MKKKKILNKKTIKVSTKTRKTHPIMRKVFKSNEIKAKKEEELV